MIKRDTILKKYRIRRLLFIVFLFFSLKLSFSQKNQNQDFKPETISSYIYNFAKYTESKRSENLKKYYISFISEKQTLIKEFKKFEKNVKINNKTLSINFLKTPEIDTSKTCLIFIASDKLYFFPKIYSLTKNKQIILVTENYFDKRKIMFNLIKKENNKLDFEIYEDNFNKKNIKVKDGIFLVGGVKINQHKIYTDLQRNLYTSELKFKKVQKEMQNLNNKIEETQKREKLQEIKINNQISLIYTQKKELQKLESIIKSNKKVLETNSNEILNQRKLLLNERQKLLHLSDSLKISKSLLTKQNNELNTGLKKLQILKDKIQKKNTEIKAQEDILGEQYKYIKKANTKNKLFYALFFLAGIILLFLLFMVLYRKRKNRILREQKEEIINKSIAIKDHLEKKRHINDLLKSKNEELSSIISQLKDTQQQLIQSEKMASLGTLTAGIAHEINNPINFVFTGANSLKKDFDDIEVILNKINELDPKDKNLKTKLEEIKILKKKHYFDEAIEAVPEIILGIKDGAARTAEIIAGLRTFGRTDYEKYVPMDIHESIDASLLILKNKYKNIINIQRNYNKNIPKIECNPGQISQVIINLLVNAIDAIFETKKENNGNIVIRTNFKNSMLIVSIKDNGAGIPDHIKAEIFDPFFTTKKIGKGTGLGLSISYGIIQEHKGKMEVFSEEGKGTEFIISLPEKS